MKSLRLMHRRCPVTTPEGRLMSLFLICFALSFVFWDLFFFKETKRNKTKPKLFCRTCLLQKARKISVLAQLTKPSTGFTQHFSHTTAAESKLELPHMPMGRSSP